MEAHTDLGNAALTAEAGGGTAPFVAFDARKWLALRPPLAPPPPMSHAPPLGAGAERILARRRKVETWLQRRPAGIG